MKFAIIGDTHSHYDSLYLFLKKQSISFALQVGDLGLYHTIEDAKKDNKSYKHDAEEINIFIERMLNNSLPPLDKDLFYIKGNHEDYDNLDSDVLHALNIHYLENGTVTNINGVLIASLGGIFSPIKSKLKEKNLQHRDRRFFTENEISILKKECAHKKIDVLLLHNAPIGYLPYKEEGLQILKDLINDVSPKLIVHGHHHINYKKKNVIGLGNFSRNQESFVIVEKAGTNLTWDP